MKREKKKFRKVNRWEERRTAARKRTWKAKSHEEQFSVIDDGLEPLKEAKNLAEEAGQKKIYKKVKEGERLLQERMKLLMFSDTEGWSASNIYAGKVEVDSNSEDERRMRSAAKEAKAAREAAEKGGTRKPFWSGRAPEPGTRKAVATTPARVPSSQPAQQFREFLCWGSGGKGHMQESSPDSNVERWPTPVAMSNPLDNDYKDEFSDNDLVSEYLDVASDVENMCVDDRRVDFFF